MKYSFIYNRLMASHSKYCSPCPQLPRHIFKSYSMAVVILSEYSATRSPSWEGGSDCDVHKIPRSLRNLEVHKHETFSGHVNATDQFQNTGSLFRNCSVLSQPSISPKFMAPKSSSLRSQVSANYPYPEPDESSLRPTTLYLFNPLSYYSSLYAQTLRLTSFLHISSRKHRMHFSSRLHLRIPPMLSSSACSSDKRHANGCICRLVSGRAVQLTNLVHLVPTLRMCGDVRPFPHTPSWCTETRLPLLLPAVLYTGMILEVTLWNIL